MSSTSESPFAFESEGLRLEGALRAGERDITGIVLHPHPLYGGDMDNHVVLGLCRWFADAGMGTLRYNSRGVGGSDGTYDGGRGEARDCVAAAAWLRQQGNGGRVLLAGYSFGAGVAAAAAPDARPDALILVSLPAMERAALPGEAPTLVITGERDDIAPPSKLEAIRGPRVRFVAVEGVDHFWVPGMDRLREAVSSFIIEQLSAGT